MLFFVNSQIVLRFRKNRETFFTEAHCFSLTNEKKENILEKKQEVHHHVPFY